jgi:hypothetical protein
MKDVDRRRDTDDDRENGTNGDDRKGTSLQNVACRLFAKKLSESSVEMGSPIPAHDELDTAE